MRALTMAVILAAGAAPASADVFSDLFGASTDIATCWYDYAGGNTGREAGDIGQVNIGNAAHLGDSRDRAWAYAIAADDQCPATLPQSALAWYDEPLTCWYGEDGAITGESHGILVDPVGQPVRHADAGEQAWGFAMTGWQERVDGRGPCPATLPEADGGAGQ